MLVSLKLLIKSVVSVGCCISLTEFSESISRKIEPLGSFLMPITFGIGDSSLVGTESIITWLALAKMSTSEKLVNG